MSDDLISRSSVLKIIEEIKCNDSIPKNYGTLLDILQAVRNLPTAYDVDKVVRQLELKILKIKKQLTYTHDEDVVTRLKCKKHDIESALEIVKAGGVNE